MPYSPTESCVAHYANAASSTWVAKSNDGSGPHTRPAMCSNNGHCNPTTGSCDCFPGYTGSECQKGTPLAYPPPPQPPPRHTHAVMRRRLRICIKECGSRHRPQRKPYLAHADGCLGCFLLRFWRAVACPNSCSNHGRCNSIATLSLQGRGVSYTNWESPVVYGCECDLGWTGPDCSLGALSSWAGAAGQWGHIV